MIIAGCGRVGSSMARRLAAEGHDVVVIDEDPGVVHACSATTSPASASSARPSTGTSLREAGIEGADAFAAVTDGDNTNIVCALIAERAFEVPCSVARVYDPAGRASSPGWACAPCAPPTRREATMLDAMHACPAAQAEG